MPWLPLAILLIAALTIAAIALILFPPGEVRPQVAEGDIIDGAGDEPDEGDFVDDDTSDNADDEATEDDLSPPSADGDPPLRGEDEEAPPESGASIAPPPPPGRNLDS